MKRTRIIPAVRRRKSHRHLGGFVEERGGSSRTRLCSCGLPVDMDGICSRCGIQAEDDQGTIHTGDEKMDFLVQNGYFEGR